MRYKNFSIIEKYEEFMASKIKPIKLSGFGTDSAHNMLASNVHSFVRHDLKGKCFVRSFKFLKKKKKIVFSIVRLPQQ